MTNDHPRWHYRATSLVNVDPDTLNEHLDAWALAGWELISASASDWSMGVYANTRHTMYWRWPVPRATEAPYGLSPDPAVASLTAASTARPRYDGIYVLPDKENGYTQGLLFRKSGTVLSVTVSGSTTAPDAVAAGATGSPYRGQIFFVDGELRFTIGGEHPTDYQGTIGVDGELKLAVHAHHNDTRRQETYRFEPLAGG